MHYFEALVEPGIREQAFASKEARCAEHATDAAKRGLPLIDRPNDAMLGFLQLLGTFVANLFRSRRPA